MSEVKLPDFIPDFLTEDDFSFVDGEEFNFVLRDNEGVKWRYTQEFCGYCKVEFYARRSLRKQGKVWRAFGLKKGVDRVNISDGSNAYEPNFLLHDKCVIPCLRKSQHELWDIEKKVRDKQYLKLQIKTLEDKCYMKERELSIFKKTVVEILPIVEALVIPDLSTMPYKEFLKTKYWKLTRKLKLASVGGRCQACNRKSGLDVHHKTYEHRGKELTHLDDLLVLCRECHGRIHNKV